MAAPDQSGRSSDEGIAPIKTGETRKVGVCTAQDQAVLDREGCQVGIGYEVACCLGLDQQPGKYPRVIWGRLWDPDTGPIEPLIDLLPSAVDGQGIAEQAGICRQAQKASSECHGRPTRPSELSTVSNQGRALACCGRSWNLA